MACVENKSIYIKAWLPYGEFLLCQTRDKIKVGDSFYGQLFTPMRKSDQVLVFPRTGKVLWVLREDHTMSLKKEELNHERTTSLSVMMSQSAGSTFFSFYGRAT